MKAWNKAEEPLVVTKNNGAFYLLDGYHRQRIAKDLGIKDVPIKEVELPWGAYKTEYDLFY